ncbi:MAG TPA: MotA/TolQ/ExbB proton channel family protein [Pseudomonadales bacterium]
MSQLLRVVLAVVLAAPLAAPALAQQADPGPAPASLEELLRQIAKVRDADKELFAERQAEFNAAPPERQQAMLAEATARRDRLEATANQLSDTFSANEIKIGNLNGELRKQANTLGLAPLFGLARQVASDVASTLQQSLIATEFPVDEGAVGRVEFLRSFAADRTTPNPEQLERLWFEIHREMTAQGRVARYRAPVVQEDGKSTDSEVIRIGPFTATSEGRFLRYIPSLGALSVLPRQLPAEFMHVLGDFEQASSGYVRAVVDSTRGVLTGLYIERPTWLERIELGETVGYVIIVVGVVGAVLFLYQLVNLIIVRIAVSRQLRNLDRPAADNPLGRVLLAFKGDPNRIEEDADIAELRISEAVLREEPKLERFQAFLRLAVAAGPLLGLIGTVVGMIITFQSITESGSSDPRLMATGIGQAMIATVLGLGIAIPLLFANALLNSLSRSVVQILDEQSAGMLAESIEKQRGV